MAIARFINAQEIMEIYNERNPTNKIGYPTALAWKKKWKKEHDGVRLPNNVIPYLWFEENFGEDAYRGLVLDDLSLAKLDVLRLNEGLSRSEFINKIIDEYKQKEKDA